MKANTPIDLKIWKIFLTLILITIIGCTPKDAQSPEQITTEPASETIIIDRESKVPTDAVKMNPQTDAAPVKSLSSEYNDPVPLQYPINTAGAEDSPFIMPDGNTLYFFFTPDVRVPVEKQVIDEVTGIYVAKKINGEWQKPERILLQEPGKAGTDGCEFAQDNVIYFCTVREGYTGIHWFKADYANGKWQNWRSADKELKTDEYKTGELHISSSNQELYFHADNKAGGKGSRDIWISKKINGEWGEPKNVAAVNTERDDGYPALNPENNELWFTRDYGTWRSKKINGEWQTPEQMFSPLAGEPSIDNAGNVYFIHHFFNKDKMIEADIYVARKK
ncbi:MAG TPA: hypothetical protein VJI32_05555 [Candidatus Nanoarchaeia archaeon]|nr:hypothetical protein [Candidatus Woesearchaeota archaeon]HLC71449.1 hypothetical protein [Candidatus Nanoarchaeia archaeon]